MTSTRSSRRRQSGAALFAEVAARLNERIEDLARSLLGEPNRALSTRAQLRFGTKGSVAIEIDGDKRGQWFDHENGVGGEGWRWSEPARPRQWRGVPLGDGLAGLRSGLGLATAASLRPPPAAKARSAKVAAIVGACSTRPGPRSSST